MRLLINATFALTLSSANVASAQPSRLACDSFAQLAVTVVQIRQQEPKANRVFEYADANLRDEYPPHVFELVKKMIGDAFARQSVQRRWTMRRVLLRENNEASVIGFMRNSGTS